MGRLYRFLSSRFVFLHDWPFNKLDTSPTRFGYLAHGLALSSVFTGSYFVYNARDTRARSAQDHSSALSYVRTILDSPTSTQEELQKAYERIQRRKRFILGEDTTYWMAVRDEEMFGTDTQWRDVFTTRRPGLDKRLEERAKAANRLYYGADPAHARGVFASLHFKKWYS